jgi:carbamoyl-phosphate synthase large subunit
MIEIAKQLIDTGFSLVATSGTAQALEQAGMTVETIRKLSEKQSPNILDYMRENRICMVINTPSGPVARADEVSIRSEAILRNIPIVTTQAGARASVNAIAYMQDHEWAVQALQDYYT